LVEMQIYYYQLQADSEQRSMMVKHYQTAVQELESQILDQTNHTNTTTKQIADIRSKLEEIQKEKERLSADLAAFDDPAQDEAAFYEYLRESEETERFLQAKLAEEIASLEKEQKQNLTNKLTTLGRNRENNALLIQERERLKQELVGIENARVCFAPLMERTRSSLNKKEEELKSQLNEFYAIVQQSDNLKKERANMLVNVGELDELDRKLAKSIESLQRELSAIETQNRKEIQDRKETADQMREEIHKLQLALDNHSGELEEEINQYFELIRIAENKLKSPILRKAIEPSEESPLPALSSSLSKPSPETPYIAPSSTTINPTPETSSLKIKRRTTPHPSKKQKDNKQAASQPIMQSQDSSTAKKRKLGSGLDALVRIISIDPLTQRVEVRNDGTTAQNLTGWRIHNPAYAFHQTFPNNLILQPQQTFTFAPQKPGQRVPPPGVAFWDFGPRDIQWPMVGAKGFLKDGNGVLKHGFP